MKIEIKLKQLKQYLKSTSQLVPLFTQLAEQSALLIEVFETRIVFRSSNDYLKLEIETLNLDNFNIIETGHILVKGKMINEIVQKMNGESVTLTQVDENILILKSEDSDYEINLIKSDKFDNEPISYNSLDEESFEIDSSIFKKKLSNTAVAVPDKSQTKILKGINIFTDMNRLNLVATDGTRIARSNCSFEGNSEINATINIKAVKELLKVIDDGKKLQFKKSGQYLYIKCEELSIKTRLLEDRYPSVSKIFESDLSLELEIDKNELVDQLERATLLNSNKAASIKMIIRDEKLKFESREIEVGYSSIWKTDFKFNSESPLMISFNPSFLLDAVKHIDDQMILIKFASAEKPFIVTGKEEKSTEHLILPFKAL